MPSAIQLTRRPYTGSCHCGHIKYIIYLSLPALPYPKTTSAAFRKESGHSIYKCNCTICHKAAIFHVRALDPANDFFIISPKNPMTDGSGCKTYVANGSINWSFCEYCGTRCFSLLGTGYNDEVDIPAALLQRVNSRTLNGTPGNITANDSETSHVTIWRPKKDWHEQSDEYGTGTEYLSINGVTLDAHNENLDLRQLHENGYVAYMEGLEQVTNEYFSTPCFGGTY